MTLYRITFRESTIPSIVIQADEFEIKNGLVAFYDYDFKNDIKKYIAWYNHNFILGIVLQTHKVNQE